MSRPLYYLLIRTLDGKMLTVKSNQQEALEWLSRRIRSSDATWWRIGDDLLTLRGQLQEEIGNSRGGRT